MLNMPPRLKLIFMHMPKTGGTSVRSALGRALGEDSIYSDYQDLPVNPCAPMNLDPDGFLETHYKCDYKHLESRDVVAGHFWIRKYDPVSTDIRATVLRSPIERAISNYFYWDPRNRTIQCISTCWSRICGSNSTRGCR